MDTMNPVYVLPKADVRPPTPPKFIRDPTDTTDIDGARPSKYYKWKPRDSFNTTDIEGAQAGWKPRHKRGGAALPRPDPMDVSEITRAGFRSTRVTDPLNPRHVVNGMVIEDEPGMRPRTHNRARDGPVLSLSTHDIEGAHAGYVPKHVMGGIHPDKRRHYRNVNYVADIEGATTGSRNLGIRTKRVTDPNNPNYPSLDGGVYEPPVTPPAQSKTLLDPKDAEIARLRAEVERMQKSEEIAHLSAEVDRLKGLPSRGGSAGGRSVPASRGGSVPGSRGGSVPASRGGGVPASRGGSERLVLVSRDGRPRVDDTAGAATVQAGGAEQRPPTHGRTSARDLRPIDHDAASVRSRPPTGGSRPASVRGTPRAASVRSFGRSSDRGTPRSVGHASFRGTPRSQGRPASVAGSGRALRSSGSGIVSGRRSATPASRREAAAVRADIAEVTALPDRPATGASMGGGSRSYR